MINILLCVDDTDDLTKAISTGKIAKYIQKGIKENNYGKCYDITRHQLFIHKDIKYTSHNSSMCFKAEINDQNYQDVIDLAVNTVVKYKSDVADPGICVVNLDKLEDKQALIDYGFKCKSQVVTKDEAYALADKLGIYLTEHGGTGIGIIGALAGCGLRLSGEDGEFKISIDLEDTEISALQMKNTYKADVIKTIDGKILKDDDIIRFESGKKKIVLKENKKIFFVKPLQDKYLACPKEQVRWIQENAKLIDEFEAKGKQCPNFEMDVEEELLVSGASCINCIYRRWQPNSIECTKE